MAEHTPTPWHVDDGFIRNSERGILCVIPNNPENGKNWKNDAAFIVKAVNNHAALVKALQTANHYCHRTSMPREAVEQIESALNASVGGMDRE